MDYFHLVNYSIDAGLAIECYVQFARLLSQLVFMLLLLWTRGYTMVHRIWHLKDMYFFATLAGLYALFGFSISKISTAFSLTYCLALTLFNCNFDKHFVIRNVRTLRILLTALLLSALAVYINVEKNICSICSPYATYLEMSTIYSHFLYFYWPTKVNNFLQYYVIVMIIFKFHRLLVVFSLIHYYDLREQFKSTPLLFETFDFGNNVFIFLGLVIQNYAQRNVIDETAH